MPGNPSQKGSDKGVAKGSGKQPQKSNEEPFDQFLEKSFNTLSNALMQLRTNMNTNAADIISKVRRDIEEGRQDIYITPQQRGQYWETACKAAEVLRIWGANYEKMPALERLRVSWFHYLIDTICRANDFHLHESVLEEYGAITSKINADSELKGGSQVQQGAATQQQAS